MKIDIRFRGAENTARDLEYVSRRVGFALGRFSMKIHSIQVRIEDVNGPRGGVDQKCGILVRMHQGGNLWVDATEVGWQEAVDRAAHRIGGSVGRALESRRAMRFESGMVPRKEGSRL